MPNFLLPARPFTPEEFADYAANVALDGAFKPSMVVLHNTAVPSLAQRPNGFSAGSMVDLRHYYAHVQKWNGGPHLFIDPTTIWLFVALGNKGTHSPSWNGVAWGVEMLGDYASEPFDTGRGAQVRNNAVVALAAMFARLGVQPDDTHFKLHKEDPRTTHSCPGKNVSKDAVRKLVLARMGKDVTVSGVPTKIVVHRKGQGQYPSAVLEGSLVDGRNLVDAGKASMACFGSAGLKRGLLPVGDVIPRALYDWKWDAPNLKLYLFER